MVDKSALSCRAKGPPVFLMRYHSSMLSTILCAVITQATPDDYLRDTVSQMKKEWPNNRMVEIVCHGHSVPAGYFKTPEIRTYDAYPNLLKQGLCLRFPHAVINVTVTAIGGENSIGGEKRFARDVLSRHPDVVTIDYGLNDRGIDPAKVNEAWVSMIHQAKAQNIKVILLTPTADKTAIMDNANDPLTQQAVAIRQLAIDESVGLVDSYSLFLQSLATGVKLDDLMSQVNHPNRAGHELVAHELLKWFPSQN